MWRFYSLAWLGNVTFREEGVDWNRKSLMEFLMLLVTFREEGVDWNLIRLASVCNTLVTFREEGVDWNRCRCNLVCQIQGHLPRGRCGLKYMLVHILNLSANVTFREEGVDWNIELPEPEEVNAVTFREEGVDWNHFLSLLTFSFLVSPSARKVWIEMSGDASAWLRQWVSPSARKVWIEITVPQKRQQGADVTFREEGVDWNILGGAKTRFLRVTFREEGDCVELRRMKS